MAAWLPILVDLSGKRCVVIGCGQVGSRRCRSLLEAGAEVLAVDPLPTPQFDEILFQSGGRREMRDYQTEDCASAFLVVACTNNRSINDQVVIDAMKNGALACHASHSEHGDVLFPATHRQGELTLAVSTGGCWPELAKRVSANWKSQFGPEWATYLELLSARREAILGAGDSIVQTGLIESEDDILNLIRQGCLDEAKRRIEDCT